MKGGRPVSRLLQKSEKNSPVVWAYKGYGGNREKEAY